MFLRRLKEYAESGREDFVMPPTLYADRPVRYIVQLDSGGQPTSDKPIDTADSQDRSTLRGRRRLVPEVVRTSGIRARLLVDDAEYTFGLGKPDAETERVAAKHTAYLDLVGRCASETGLSDVAAVVSFLDNGGASDLDIGVDFDSSALITFSIEGRLPIEFPQVQRFWVDEVMAGQSGLRLMQCIICGETKPALKRLKKKVKGIPGGNTSGTSLISANEKVFESYGLKNSEIAPSCADCAEKFTEALNHLLSSEHSNVAFPKAKFIFWTREETKFNFGNTLRRPDDAEVQEETATLFRGGYGPDFDDMEFYGAMLSASGGRTVVRDWVDTTVRDVRQRLMSWFEAQAIAQTDGAPTVPIGIFALSSATVLNSRNIPPNTPQALLRCALTGTPLPRSLLSQAIGRNRAEQRVTRPRAGLIKAVLYTNEPQNQKEGYMVELEREVNNPGYLCGRLLYVLEDAQRAAIPGISATIVSRYYGTASSAPRSVFSRLLRGAQAHLSKLERDKPRVHGAIQNRMTNIMEQLPSFPRVLTLEEQGLFALGFYHQRADQRRGRKEAAEQRASQS